jgi:transcriptional regulator with XRE-family HTH domain
MTFEVKLKKLLEKHRLSISELSKISGVPKTNIQQWLTGSSPNIKQIDKVARYFKMSIEELYFDRQQIKSESKLIDKIEITEGEYKITVKKITN